MQGGSGWPVCWALTSRGTAKTRRAFASAGLVFRDAFGTVLQVKT